MTEQIACTLCGAGGHTAAQCNWNQGAAAFQREERYIVIKRKDLALVPAPYRDLLLKSLGEMQPHIPQREYVVVESDWPEYETVWAMIEARVNGKHPEQAEGAKREREEFSAWWNHAAQWELRKSCAMGWGEKVWRAARAALAQPSPAPEPDYTRLAESFIEELTKRGKCVVAIADIERIQKERDAAQSRIAELELKLSTSDYAYDSGRSHMRGMARKAADAIQVFTGHDSGANLIHRYGMHWWEPLNELRDQLRAFVNGAPVAQAGQVPENVRDELARRCLWLAFCWNDHNFEAAHICARKEAEKHGIASFDEANAWLAAAAPQPAWG